MFSAAILNGGQATRFGGRDKSALIVDGRTIRDRQIAELSLLTDDILVVTEDLVDLPPRPDMVTQHPMQPLPA